jgi:hypothetical protein
MTTDNDKTTRAKRITATINIRHPRIIVGKRLDHQKDILYRGTKIKIDIRFV